MPKGTSRRQLKRVALILIALCSFGFLHATGKVETGALGELFQGLEDRVRTFWVRPGASWRKAVEALNDWVPAQGTPGTFDINGRVVRVSDGDTISVLDGNREQHKIRFHGIDTPEYDQPHGTAATKALAALVADKDVGVVIMDTDRLGRTVGIVYAGGVNINLEMVRAGHAWWYQRYAGSNRGLDAAQRQARESGLGLWGQEAPIPPWDWRRGKR